MNNFIQIEELHETDVIGYLRENEFDFEEYERLRSLFEDELMLSNNIIEEDELYY